jgi:hypothetical protein
MTIVGRSVFIDMGGDFKKRFIKTVARVSYDDDDFYSRMNPRDARPSRGSPVRGNARASLESNAFP